MAGDPPPPEEPGPRHDSRDHDDTGDRELARAAASGDRRALETLLGRHLDRVHAVCRRVTGNADDALDATQETLIAVSRGIGRYDGRAAFTTWLYRVATNAALDEVRRRSRRPQPVAEVHELAVHPELEGAEGRVESRVAARVDVDAALGHLRPEFRAAVVLRDLCDLDYAEIADTLGVPVGTVRSRIARGRAALADIIGNRATPAGRPSGAHAASGNPEGVPEGTETP